MHALQTGYALYFNKKHNRVGHLTQGRFASKIVSEDLYLLRLSRYIHLNPVHTSIAREKSFEERVALLRAYKWSSYPGYAGIHSPLKFMDYGPICALISDSTGDPRRKYSAYVEEGIGWTDDEAWLAASSSKHAIGSPAYIEEVRARYENVSETFGDGGESPAFRATSPELSDEEVLIDVAGRHGVELQRLKSGHVPMTVRLKAARRLMKEAGLSQCDAALLLGWNSGSALAMQLKRGQHGHVYSKSTLQESLPL